MLMTMTMNDNEKHFFGENNEQCYKYIICKKVRQLKTLKNSKN